MVFDWTNLTWDDVAEDRVNMLILQITGIHLYAAQRQLQSLIFCPPPPHRSPSPVSESRKPSSGCGLQGQSGTGNTALAAQGTAHKKDL